MQGMELKAEIDSFSAYVNHHFPKGSISEDNDGQLIIYTNLKQAEDGRIRDIETLEKFNPPVTSVPGN